MLCHVYCRALFPFLFEQNAGNEVENARDDDNGGAWYIYATLNNTLFIDPLYEFFLFREYAMIVNSNAAPILFAS